MVVNMKLVVALIFLSTLTFAEREKCVFTLANVRYYSTSGVICGELSFNTGVYYLHQQFSTLNLNVSLDVITGGDTKQVYVSNQICQEYGNIGEVSDHEDMMGVKTGIYLCGKMESGLNIVNVSVDAHQKLDVVVYMKKRNEQQWECSIDNIIETVNVVKTEIESRSDNCRVTCSSLTIGNGGECVDSQKGYSEHVHLYQDIKSMPITLLHIKRSGVMCVELTLDFSSDVQKFYLHDDTKLFLSNTQETKQNPIKIDNNECVSTIGNYLKESPHAVWNKTVYLCTSKTMSPLGKIQLHGKISYVAVLLSGRRIKQYQKIKYTSDQVGMKKEYLLPLCNLDEVKSTCRDCRVSCTAAVTGMGHLYCKGGWMYVSAHNNNNVLNSSSQNYNISYYAKEDNSKQNSNTYTLFVVFGSIFGITTFIFLSLNIYKKRNVTPVQGYIPY